MAKCEFCGEREEDLRYVIRDPHGRGCSRSVPVCAPCHLPLLDPETAKKRWAQIQRAEGVSRRLRSEHALNQMGGPE